MDFSRRDLLRFAPMLLALSFMPRTVLALAIPSKPGHAGNNFRYIYENKALREQFHLFLQNVYSLYPDPEAHKLIYELTAALQEDEAIYRALQRKFPDIKPMLSLFRKSLPALQKQKEEMRQQTKTLLNGMSQATGYIEIGTTGRYTKGIKKSVKLKGQTYILNTDGPTYSPGDIAERGQLTKAGQFVQLGDYDPLSPDVIPHGSVDLISNYIGFHHAPPAKRDAFIKSVVDTLRPGGKLVLRDHDATTDDLKFIVALAHDVFNAGLDINWETNWAEVRNFVDLQQITDKLAAYGMVADSRRLLQEGDPTRNTLAVFTKT